MTKSIIAAIGRERELGVRNTIPWDLPEDRKKFKELTNGHTVIMGRNTYESIVNFLGKPLPNRTNIIVTTDRNFKAPGCIVVHSLEEAWSASPDNEVFIIGGATIYEQTLPTADKIYLTEIDEVFPEADAFFPELNHDEWEAVQTVPLPKSDTNPINACLVVYEKRKPTT